jgi:hypothetical protein
MIVLACVPILSAVLLVGDLHTETLISTQRHINLPDWELSSAQITPSSPTPWSIRKRRLAGGKQDGVDVVVLDNGALVVEIVPTRGMGIWQVTLGDLRLGWDSPVQEIVHPRHVELGLRGGLGWLEGFGEFLCRCGLENNGHPGQDVIIDNTGAESTVDLTLHGKQAYIPAQEVVVAIDTAPPYRLRVRGRVSERMMHGPKLDLVTEISTEPGSTTLRIADVITNASTQPTEFQILYHANFGAPLLGDGSTLRAPLQRVVPFNDRAAEGDIRSFARYGPPTAGFVEQVYCAELYAGADGKTTVALVNSDGDRAASMTYAVRELPYLTVWKNTAAVEDGYVTGIEPGTNFPYNRRLERVAGRVPKLQGGESYAVTLDIGLHVGSDPVSAVVQSIEKLQQDRPTEFVEQPRRPILPK